MSERLVYTDEDLPEIEISEFITADEYADESEDGEGTGRRSETGRNFYTDDQIYNQMDPLLKKFSHESDVPLKQKIQCFMDIHKNILTKRPFDVPTNIIPKVSIARKNNDDEEEPTFFQNHDEASKISAYDKRVDELHKVFLGFETVSEDPPVLPDIASPTHVYFDENSQTVILPEDELHGSVEMLFKKRGISPFNPNFYKLTLIDKINQRTGASSDAVTSYEINTEMTLEENIESLILKSIEESIQDLEKISTLYDLWKDFLEIGIDYNDYNDNKKYINTEVINALFEKIKELQKFDTEVVTILTKTKEYSTIPMTDLDAYSIHGFYLAQQRIFMTIQPLLKTLKSDLLKLYEEFINAEHHSISTEEIANIPNNAYDIAVMIMDNRVTIEDVIKGLKIRSISEQRASIEKWFILISEWDPDTISSALARELKLASKTLLSNIDEPLDPWLSIDDEIAHIKLREVISKYYDDGQEPMRTAEEQEKADAHAIYEEDIVIDTGDPDDDIPIPTYDDSLPSDISGLDEGTREIYEIVIRMFMTLQKSSGLPLDYDRLTLSVPIKNRRTKFVQIEEAFPDLSTEVHQFLDKALPEDIDNINKTYIDPLMYKTTKDSFLKIYQAYIKDIEYQVVYLLCWWICDLQKDVLQHVLHFHVWQAAISCLNVWGPYGYPMEDSASKSTDGIMPYLLCVINGLISIEGFLWNKYTGHLNSLHLKPLMITVFKEDFAEMVTRLRQQFKSFDKDIVPKGVREKGNAVREQIIETIAQKVKSRYLTDYMNFLKNMPSVQIDPSIAKKLHIGCCLRMLGDKHESDYKWETAGVKQAYNLKISFARERIGFENRPFLVPAGVPSDADLPSPDRDIVAIVPPSPEYKDHTITELIANFEHKIPEYDFKKMSTNITDIIPITKKYLEVLANTTTVIDTTINTFFEESTNQTFIECIRKVLQLQYIHIQTDYLQNPIAYEFLKTEFEKSFKLYESLLNNRYTGTEFQMVQHKRILQYFLVRQLCFPAKPEFARNNTLVLLEATLDATLLKNFLRNTIDTIKTWIISKNFNKSHDFKEYIAKMFEEEKTRRLNIVDKMSTEERNAYKQAKALGIPEVADYMSYFANMAAAQEEAGRAGRAEMGGDSDDDENQPDIDSNLNRNDDEVDEDSLNDIF